jgi:hypothetical protein
MSGGASDCASKRVLLSQFLDTYHRTRRLANDRVRIRARPASQAAVRAAAIDHQISVQPLGRTDFSCYGSQDEPAVSANSAVTHRRNLFRRVVGLLCDPTNAKISELIRFPGDRGTQAVPVCGAAQAYGVGSLESIVAKRCGPLCHTTYRPAAIHGS